jgi:hypothetical protein
MENALEENEDECLIGHAEHSDETVSHALRYCSDRRHDDCTTSSTRAYKCCAMLFADLYAGRTSSSEVVMLDQSHVTRTNRLLSCAFAGLGSACRQRQGSPAERISS